MTSTEIDAPFFVAEPTSLNEADILKMTMKIIKENLKGRGLATTGGQKQVLVERLIDAVCNNVPLVENQNEEVLDNFSAAGFNAGEY